MSSINILSNSNNNSSTELVKHLIAKSKIKREKRFLKKSFSPYQGQAYQYTPVLNVDNVDILWRDYSNQASNYYYGIMPVPHKNFHDRATSLNQSIDASKSNTQSLYKHSSFLNQSLEDIHYKGMKKLTDQKNTPRYNRNKSSELTFDTMIQGQRNKNAYLPPMWIKTNSIRCYYNNKNMKWTQDHVQQKNLLTSSQEELTFRNNQDPSKVYTLCEMMKRRQSLNQSPVFAETLNQRYKNIDGSQIKQKMVEISDDNPFHNNRQNKFCSEFNNDTSEKELRNSSMKIGGSRNQILNILSKQKSQDMTNYNQMNNQEQKGLKIDHKQLDKELSKLKQIKLITSTVTPNKSIDHLRPLIQEIKQKGQNFESQKTKKVEKEKRKKFFKSKILNLVNSSPDKEKQLLDMIQKYMNAQQQQLQQ